MRTCPDCGHFTCFSQECPVCLQASQGTKNAWTLERREAQRQRMLVIAARKREAKAQARREGMEALARMVVGFDRA